MQHTSAVQPPAVSRPLLVADARAVAPAAADGPYDVVLIGAGIMSATLGTLLAALEPSWRIAIVERLDTVAAESSDAWNNAGTGHAALCELNYTPEAADGTVSIAKAQQINDQFTLSRQFWGSLIRAGVLGNASDFLTVTPHMTFVTGGANISALRRRHTAMVRDPRFASMEFSDKPAVIAQWAPLLMEGRPAGTPVAATRVREGADVNFGALTRQMVAALRARGADVLLEHEVTGLTRSAGGWTVALRDHSWNAPRRARHIDARFVFVGAGGRALPLLQNAGIEEIQGYGGFPISGKFLRARNPNVVARHHAKVYGKASVGSPPMSVPHLDTRVVDGEHYLLFGPYAGFSPRFLKSGSVWDLPRSLRPANLGPMLSVAAHNVPLMRYLIGQLTAREEATFAQLQQFVPLARPADWEWITAGQRVQVIKPDGHGGGVLQFGTELITAADRTIAGLLGASPGASTAVPIMLNLIARCFPDKADAWRPQLAELVPGSQPAREAALAH